MLIFVSWPLWSSPRIGESLGSKNKLVLLGIHPMCNFAERLAASPCRFELYTQHGLQYRMSYWAMRFLCLGCTIYCNVWLGDSLSGLQSIQEVDQNRHA